MVIALDADLECLLKTRAEQDGITPDELAGKLLRERLAPKKLIEPRDEWERGLLESIRDWGVSFSDLEVSSEGLYE